MMSKKSSILLLVAALLAPAPDLFAQRGVPPASRTADQEDARRKLLDGSCMPLSVIRRRVEQETGGAAFLDVEPLNDPGVIRLKYDKAGKVIWYDVNCRTGDIKARSR